MDRDQIVTLACVGSTLALGAGVLLLQLRTLNSIAKKDNETPWVSGICTSVAEQLQHLHSRAAASTGFGGSGAGDLDRVLAALARAQCNGIVTVIFDEKLSVRSDGMRGRADAEGHGVNGVNDERIAALSSVLQRAPKTEAVSRAVASFSRADSSVRQNEMAYRWVEPCGLWVVALRF